MPLKYEIAWKYAEKIPKTNSEGKMRVYVECKFCKKQFLGGAIRVKNHLAKTRKDVAPCQLVPPAVQKEIEDYLNVGSKSKLEAQRIREELIDNGSYYLNEDPCHVGSSGGSVSPRGVRGTMDKYVNVGCDEVNPDGEKESQKNCCLDIGRFFFENGIPFNVANSPSFISMIRSLGNYGRGLKPPTFHDLSTWILDEEVKTTQGFVDDIKKTWPLTGVSIISDGWKDTKGRSLINFLVNNPHGTVFLKSVDASNEVKTSHMLCKLFEKVIDEVGKEYVTQVITNNASIYKGAGKLLMERNPRIWWTPCAAHCIDLILEKIGESPQHTNALKKAKKVCNYIYNHSWLLALMRKFTNSELIRPAATRFATAYLTLDNLERLRKPLEQMFSSTEWKNSSYASDEDGEKVMSIIVRDPNFWEGVNYALKSTKPLVNVLRMVGSGKMPGMGFVYGCMDKAKTEIVANLKGKGVGAFSEILKIIDNKWEFQMHRDLHIVAHSLNPHFQYDETLPNVNEVTASRIACLTKIYPDEDDQHKVEIQMDTFRNKLGLFGFNVARSTAKKRSPVDWWIQYGQETPELMKFAVRILSLTCSSSVCHRNWSMFNQVHTNRRNRLTTSELNNSVFIMYNKKLKNKWFKMQSLQEDEDPLVLEEIPSDDEWIVDPNENLLAQSHDVVETDNEDDVGDEDNIVGEDKDNIVDKDPETKDNNQDNMELIRYERRGKPSASGSGRGSRGGVERGRGRGRGRERGRAIDSETDSAKQGKKRKRGTKLAIIFA